MDKFTNGLNHPIDIAFSLMVCSGRNISELKNLNSPEGKDVLDAIYQLQNMANDNSYHDYWKKLYCVLSRISDIPEYAPLPF